MTEFCNHMKLFCLDKEIPKLLNCPSNIEKETDKDQVMVTWDEPQYTDNCGNYSKCPLKIIPSNYPGSNFHVNSETLVYYTASDPSNNRNVECTFTIKIKKKQGKTFATWKMDITLITKSH